MNKRRLRIAQLEEKMRPAAVLAGGAYSFAWIRTVRTALGMSLEQLAGRLSISKQSVGALEKREEEGAVSLTSLRAAADALDMQLVYAFVPKDGSLEALIERKAQEAARKIVFSASQNMKLEDQENSRERLQKAVNERVMQLKFEIPKILWD